MKNRKEWRPEVGPRTGGSPDGAEAEGIGEDLPDVPLITIYPNAAVLRLRVVQIVCGISAMVMGTVAFIEERGRLNLGLGIPAGAATVLAAGVSIHLSRSFSGHGVGVGVGGSGAGVLWRLRRIGPLAGCWIVACFLHTTLIVAATTAFVAQVRNRAGERNTDILIVSVVQLSLSLGTLAAEAALVAVECRRRPFKSD